MISQKNNEPLFFIDNNYLKISPQITIEICNSTKMFEETNKK